MVIMRVEYAALLGFIIGLFNLIPFFGAIIAWLFLSKLLNNFQQFLLLHLEES